MPELFDADGNKVEAFTKEELDTKLKEQQDAEIAKNVDKDKNFAKLREEKEASDKLAKDKETEAETAKREKDEALAAKDKEFAEKELQKERAKVVEQLAEGKQEVKDKIEFHLKRLAGEIKTPEDFERVAKDAYILATGQQMPDKLNGVISSGGAQNKGGGGTAKLPISEEALPVANKLGVSQADLEKYKDQI